MTPGRRAAFAVLNAAFACAAAVPAAAGAPDVAIDGSWGSQECAAGESCADEALTFRIGSGDRLRWHLSGGLIRASRSEGIARTIAGAVPLHRDQILRRNDGRGLLGAGGPMMPAQHAAHAPGPYSTGESWAGGADDLYAGIGARLAGGGSRLFALGLELEVKAPVASEERYLGTGEWDGRAGLTAERRFWSMTLFGGAGWSRIGDPEWADLRDAPDAYLGVESEPLGAGLRWSAWIEGSGEIVEGAGPLASIAAGCRPEGPGAWRVSLRAGLTRASESFGIRAGYAWGGGRRPARSEGAVR